MFFVLWVCVFINNLFSLHLSGSPDETKYWLKILLPLSNGILGNDLSGIGLEPTLDDGVDSDV